MSMMLVFLNAVVPRVMLSRWLAGCLSLLLCTATFAAAVDQKQQLANLCELWAKAATQGDVDTLMSLYDPEAFIHVVFTQEELRGEKAIREYYTKYEQHPPKVSILNLEENSVLNGTIGILSGLARVEFPGQPPMTTHFSIVGHWKQGRWQVKIQTTVKVE